MDVSIIESLLVIAASSIISGAIIYLSIKNWLLTREISEIYQKIGVKAVAADNIEDVK